MKTITIEVYWASELEEKNPEGFKRAHEDYVRHLWESGWGVESITLFLRDIEDEEGSPLSGRPLEWDLYRGQYVCYAGGRLTCDEMSALTDLYPELGEDGGPWLRIDGGMVRSAEDWDLSDKEAEAVFEINKVLYDMYARMLENARDQEEHLESVEYFLDACDANDWTFEVDGRIRNA